MEVLGGVIHYELDMGTGLATALGLGCHHILPWDLTGLGEEDGK